MFNPTSCEVAHRKIVGEVESQRIVVLTLAPGQFVPWHYHSEITGTFFCLDGPMVIETRAVQTKGGRTQSELV